MTKDFNNFYNLMMESIGKTLYHGTCKSKFYDLKNVQLHGGIDDDGSSLVSSAYGNDSDYFDDPDYVDEREVPVFAADKTTFDKAVTAMTWCLASKKSKGKHPDMRAVTWNEVRSDGIIFVFYDTDTENDWQQHDPYSHNDNSERFKGLEDEDYYNPNSVRPDGRWEGSKLVSMLKRKGYKFK